MPNPLYVVLDLFIAGSSIFFLLNSESTASTVFASFGLGLGLLLLTHDWWEYRESESE